MSILWRSWAAVAAVTFAVLAVFVGLATVQFGSLHAHLVGERLIVLADRTVTPFAAAVRLGLPLASVRNAVALLERARQTDDDIVALLVFDESGRIVHAAGDPAAATTGVIGEQALRARAGANGEPWFMETGLGFVASVDLPRPDGRSAGGILIVYPSAGSGTQVRAMLAALSLTALGVLLCTSLAAGLLLRWGLRRPLREHDRIEAICGAFEAGTWRRAAGRPPDDDDAPTTNASGPEGLRDALRTAEARYLRAGHMIEGRHTAVGIDVDGRPLTAASRGGEVGHRFQLTLMLAIVVFGAVLAMSAGAIDAFQRVAAPELDKRTRLIGVVLRAEMQRALELGIALDAMAGLDRYLADTLRSFDEIARIDVRGGDGRSVAAVARTGRSDGQAVIPATPRSTATKIPVLDGNRLVGEIHIDVTPGFVQTRMRDILLDVLALGGVATLLALEGVLAVVVATATAPLRRLNWLLQAQQGGDFRHRLARGAPGAVGRMIARLNDHASDLAERLAAKPASARDALRRCLQVRVADGRPLAMRLADVGDIRLALLLFSTASEVTVAFLPVYTRTLMRPEWLAPEWAAAAPLLAYLVAMLALAPVAGRLVDRIGARRLFLASVPPTVLALGGLMLATHVAEVVFWRALMAVFYATATIACQGYALRAAGPDRAALPGAAFVAVVHGGVFCGTVIGGVVAGRFGVGAALAAGAVIAMLAGAVAALAMRGAAATDPRATTAAASMAVPATPITPTRGLRALLVGVAMPMSAATSAAVWYLAPLMLHDSGSGAADTARVIMLYYLAVVLLTPAAARLADGRVGLRRIALAGASTAALALGLGFQHGLWSVVAAVGVLGVGHALLRATLLALSLRLAAPGHDGAAALRVHERAGAIAGLASCAMLLPVAGPQDALRALALVTIAGMLSYALTGRTATAPAIGPSP